LFAQKIYLKFEILLLSIVGALHSTSQIAGLLCWLCDIIKTIVAEHEDSESSEKVSNFFHFTYLIK